MIEQLVKATIKRSDLTSSAKWVLVALAIKQGRYRSCAISRGYLAKETGLEISTVKRSLALLLDKNLITCDRKRLDVAKNAVNVYSVIWVNNFHRRAKWLDDEAKAKQVIA